MDKAKLSGLLILPALLAAPAAAQEFSFDGMPSVKEIVAQAKAGDAAVAPSAMKTNKAPVKEWTIMVFMNGKNNLSEYVHSDMNEMETVGSTDKINVVTQSARSYQAPASNPGYPGGWNDWDNGPVVPHPGWPNPYWNDMPPMMGRGAATRGVEDWTGVRRYYVTKDTDTAVTGSMMLQDMGKVDMGDWNQLVEFGRWAKANYPARHYMLIVWNHGDGWKTKSPRSALTRGISYDDETGNGITTVQLGQALAGMGGVDIYASDACLMQMAEVIYELKNSAQVMVGSEETEPGAGWDYGAFLSRIKSFGIENVAKAAVEGYTASYAAKGTGVTMAAARSNKAEQLRQLTDQWADLAMKQDKAKLLEALREAKSFGGADSRDLLHFLSVAGTKIPALQAKGAEITAFFNGSMLVKNATNGDAYKNATGIAMYLPSYSFDENYSKLALSKAGKWDEFTKWLLEK